MNTTDIKRIKKGWKYFYDLKPSKFNPSNKLWLTRFLTLIKPLVFKEKTSDAYEMAKKIFK